MFRKLASVVLVGAFVGLTLQTAGCKKDVKKFCNKLSKCTDEVAEEMVARKTIPKAALDVTKKALKKQWGDPKACLKKFKGKTIKKSGKECASKKNCKEFAKCFVNIATKHKK